MTKHYHKKSVDRVKQCADNYYLSSDNDPATIVRDMLADLRHYCDEHRLCLGDLDRVAHKYYQDEMEMDREGVDQKPEEKQEPWGIMRMLKHGHTFGSHDDDKPVGSLKEAKDMLRHDDAHNVAILFTEGKLTVWQREAGSRKWQHVVEGECKE